MPQPQPNTVNFQYDSKDDVKFFFLFPPYKTVQDYYKDGALLRKETKIPRAMFKTHTIILHTHKDKRT